MMEQCGPDWRKVRLPNRAALVALQEECQSALVPAETAEIAGVLDRLGDVLPMPTDGPSCEIYIRALKDYPVKVLRRAAWETIRSQEFPRAPTVAELVKRCEEHPEWKAWRKGRAAVEYAAWCLRMRETEAREAEARRAREEAFWRDLRAKYAHLPKKVSMLSQATVHDETPAEFAARKAEVLRKCQQEGIL